jgi:Ala-tRNA(Pro) deacylase
MSATPDDLFAFLDKLGIATKTVSHAALFTVAQSQALRGSIEGGHTKNLFLKDKKGRLFLVVAAEDAAIDLKRLHALIGASGRLSFAGADEMRARLGVEPGAVTPFGLMHDREGAITAVLDAGLMASDRLNFHPLVNTMTTTIARDDLVAFLEATGHAPNVVALAS